MKRSLFLPLVAGGVVFGTVSFETKALAEGVVTISNKTIDGSVMVEARIGSALDDAATVAKQPLKKGESLTVDSTNLQCFWHREVNPDANDGKWTDWQRVDTRYGDQHVSF